MKNKFLIKEKGVEIYPLFLCALYSYNVDYANIRYYKLVEFSYSQDDDQASRAIQGCIMSSISSQKDYEQQSNRLGREAKTSFDINYGNSSNETRPKTKFFNLLIYAGYPIS